MAEFKITRFRYTWKGDWAGDSTTYYKDDVVLYSGKAWVCKRQHTSNVFEDAQTFTFPGETNPSPAWIQMTDGREFTGVWTSGRNYDTGVYTLHGGNVWICVNPHLSGAYFIDNINDWEVFATGVNFVGNWTPNFSKYKAGDVVKYNGYVYQCVLEHTAGSITEGIAVGNNDDINDSTGETWQVVVENIEYRGEYATNTRYRVNDYVKYGGSILLCTTEHTSSFTPGVIDSNNFSTLFSGFNYYNSWSSTVYYAVGDVVRAGGTLYVATNNNYNNQPGQTVAYPNSNPNWTAIVEATDFKGAYTLGDPYKQGDLVRRGSNLWLALQDVLQNDSTLDYADDSNWQLIIPTQGWRGTWDPDNVIYYLNDVVYYKGSTYICNTGHTSIETSYPGDNGNGFYYWTLLVQGDSEAALDKLGDLITYNYNRSVVGDTSTLGPTPVSIPYDQSNQVEYDKVLIVEDDQGTLGYATWGNTERRFYVRTNGVDDNTDPNRGKNYFKPWRTLRYALEQVDDGFEGTTTILLSAGEFEEILPLIVPARTAILGEELRSTTIRANRPIAALEGDAEYTLLALVRISSILNGIITASPISKTTGNTLDQDMTLMGGNNSAVVLADAAITHIISLIDYRVNGLGTSPAITGTNTASTASEILIGRHSLLANKNFLAEEAVVYIQSLYPVYNFDTDRCKRDIGLFIDAIAYDMLYPGTYKSNLAARYYANAVTGSQLEDMFYVRDSTGMKNLTLKGLEGTLPELQAGQDYRIPTGGSFVSLDPGWGPNDERVWITNRSCYVQNITTFGFGAIGQKIDGALHNGGNKSIVSNDFTQVISDGIGAWVANGGRAELVSVFTYYANIGMFATEGGVIRATNGNSSYGRFGAVADGIDPNENVRYGYLNTRLEEAQVYSAFAGEINDFVFALEWSHAGENYTTAAYNITSSGTGAQAQQEEFRDNAVFTCEVFSGGEGFNLVGNQAQSGNPLVITLASSETATAEEIEGMRILIVSGEGTGQYGIVDSYNEGTRQVTVKRESDGQFGWDHLIPGWPVAQLLTTGTRYRIEPRPVFSDPPFTASPYTLVAASSWVSAIYGETDETYTSVAGNTGTGETIEIVPEAAIFDVQKLGRNYVVSLVDGGAGYAIGDLITIAGSDVGGIDGEHDVKITVAAVSDDSTNSILGFTSRGVAISGNFVLLPSTGIYAQWSQDGEIWDLATLPTSGNWKAAATGNYKFVAISYGTSDTIYSIDGINWTLSAMPTSRNWNGLAYGKPSNSTTGLFVAVAGNLNAAAFSTDGINWSNNSLPTFGDSTFNEWVDIAYGNDKFVAIANSGNIAAVGTWTGSTITWTGAIMDTSADSSPRDWIKIAYGNQRFVAISSTGDVGYSFNGSDWYQSSALPKPDGSTVHNWKQIKYGQGVFFAIGDSGSKTVAGDPTTGPTTFCATSYDGIVWTSRELADSANWGVLAFGSIDTVLGDSTYSNNRPTWIVATSDVSSVVNKVFAGCRALGRVYNATGINRVVLWEPGSGYVGKPTLTFEDPNKIIEPIVNVRVGDGVLGQPSWISRGSAYKTSTTIVSVIGDGYADITPTGKFITLDDLDVVPGPGAQFYIAGRTSYFVAVVVGLDQEPLPNGKIRSRFQISPSADYGDYLEHNMEVLIREQYSQVRITGHDFLDVGSGNFVETNYPELYADYLYDTDPLAETALFNGGRVFYTSTDQDGNFRAGEQFAVEQATGIITISADFFDLQGLTELRLAGVQVGSTAIIREFSKDPLFLQNSNNVIPTQRAIVGYLQSRLNVGGEDLLTPSVIAGTVKVGPNEIDNTASLTVNIPVMADFSGSQAKISGSIIAQNMFYRSFN